MTGRTRPAQDWPAIAYRVAVELLGEPNSPLSNAGRHPHIRGPGTHPGDRPTCKGHAT